MSWLSSVASHWSAGIKKATKPAVQVVKQIWPQARAPAEAAVASYFGGPQAGAAVLKLNQAAATADQARKLSQARPVNAGPAFTPTPHLIHTQPQGPMAWGSNPHPNQPAQAKPVYGPVLIVAAVGAALMIRGRTNGHT